MRRAGAAPQRGEEGVVAVIVALLVLSLLVVSAIVIDIAQARLDRQASKSAADASVMAGLKSADGGGSDVFTKRAVCGALSFLRSNEPALAGLPAGPCGVGWATDTTVCDPSSPAGSTVDYNQNVTSGGVGYTVQIKAPYQTSEGNFPEESYGTLAGDQSAAGMNGCDQLAVIITKSRAPLFGQVVSNDPLVTKIRSVGRVTPGDGDTAPALLLLERTQCNVLSLGAAGGGSGSHIRVYGTATTPGSIHADTYASDGSSCGTSNGKQVFQGKQAGGIVAYGSTDGVAGMITSVASAAGVAAGIVSDGIANVYGTTAADENSAGSGTGPVGRSQVTRKPVDERYLSGVRSAVGNPQPTTFARTITSCAPTAAQLVTIRASLLTLSGADAVRFDCSGGDRGLAMGTQADPVIVPAGTVVIDGWVKGGGLDLSAATSVYVNQKASSGSAIKLGTGNTLCVRAPTCTAAPINQCSTTPTGARSRLFVRTGTLEQSGGLLRLCNTTVYMLGGPSDGCLPSSPGTAPTSTPCSGASGDGQLKINGGVTDWTAPSQYAGVIPEGVQASAWEGGEDLAMWAESAGEYTMAGGGSMQLVGVLMAPNAAPFSLTGGGAQALRNAQYIVRRFSLAGGATLTMTVDPHSAVTLPRLESFLVR